MSGVPLLKGSWPGARETQATRRRRRFGPKSAPRHRDFGPGRFGCL